MNEYTITVNTIGDYPIISGEIPLFFTYQTEGGEILHYCLQSVTENAFENICDLKRSIFELKDELTDIQRLLSDYEKLVKHCENQRKELALYHALYDQKGGKR